jgi:hypothetical protein
MPATPTPDMADALSMDTAAAPPPPGGDDLFGAAEPVDDAGMGEFGDGDAPAETDPMFAADAGDLFPDFDDEQLGKLQRLIDSRLGGGAPAL